MRTPIAASLLALLALGVPSPASAQESSSGFAPSSSYGGGFGGAGQIAISGELDAHLHSGWNLRIRPAADYFIIHNLSLGGAAGINYDATMSPSATTIELGARVGYSIGINGQVGIWPRGGIFYSHYSRHPDSSSSANVRIDAPLLYHLVPHLFVGAVPSFAHDLNGGGQSYGIDSTVGGWF